MQGHPNPRRRRPRGGTIHLATGYAVRVRVDQGHLVVDDGAGRHRRTTRYNRATGNLSRLVIVASTGYISLEATRWLADTGCKLVHLDHTGRVLQTSAGLGVDQPALRRAQARAAERPVGIEISRRLLGAKLEGQQEVAQTLDADAAAAIEQRLAALQECRELDALRLVEAQAAAVYWAAWRGVQARFITRDASRVPEHWSRFGQRGSLLTGGPRVASDPINCCLNWLYGLLEAEAGLALVAVGLDPGLGFLHTDQPARDSLALDLMEAARPAVDSYLLGLLADRPLRRSDFHETSSGQCRLMPSLASEFAGTASTWAGILAPYAELVAQLLATDAGLPTPPTLLTQTSRRAARPAGDQTRPHYAPRPASHRVCVDCGQAIPAGRKRCPTCHTHTNHDRLARLQTAETARRHASGERPTSTPQAREKTGASQRAQWRARASASDAGSGYTGGPAEFRRLILPRLTDTQPAALAAATGLSRGYCAQIRDGHRVPHVRHWAALHLTGLAGSA